MTNKILTLAMPTAYTPEELTKAVQKKIGTLPYRIAKQSLDCRKKSRIHWVVQIEMLDKLNPLTDAKPCFPKNVKNPKSVTIIGSGPAGIFSAIVLAEAGFPVTLLERGHHIEQRKQAISEFEQGKQFCEQGNYAFGEGGAGAFSDGKLTSRSKNISAEREFVHQAYIEARAPQEIAYLAHPHVGSDILFAVTKSLRKRFQEAGGTIIFDSKAENFRQKGKEWLIDFSGGQLSSSYIIAAPGHSARDTLKAIIRCGIPFQPKAFALGMRAEHPQQLINQSQWGQTHLAGIKAAEYRLTANGGVYSFCMCPGGRIIQAAPFDDVNIVNGMSLYARDGRWANAAVVATYNPLEDCQQNADALTILEWLTDLERKFKTNFGFQAPCISIQDFIQGKSTRHLPKESSYLLGMTPFDPWDYLPKSILPRLKDGLSDFCRKLKGYETGFLLGLESKTSSPIQALRDDNGESLGCQGFYVVGEASGRAGGIVSSAADGIKAALSIIKKCN